MNGIRFNPNGGVNHIQTPQPAQPQAKAPEPQARHQAPRDQDNGTWGQEPRGPRAYTGDFLSARDNGKTPPPNRTTARQPNRPVQNNIRGDDPLAPEDPPLTADTNTHNLTLPETEAEKTSREHKERELKQRMQDLRQASKDWQTGLEQLGTPNY